MPAAFGPPSAGAHAGAGLVDRGVDPLGEPDVERGHRADAIRA